MVAEERIEEIVAIARRPTALSLPKVTFVSGDVSKDDPTRWFEGVDAVVHLAWDVKSTRDRKRSWKNNVEGSARVFSAAARAGVRAIVHASSVGVYSPAPRDSLVEESWPRDGVPTSRYSLEKAAVERELDSLQTHFPRLRIVRIRPALVFKREAASGIQRLFLGPFFPRWLLEPGRVPAIPVELSLQCVHSLDVGEAFRRAVVRDVRGAFNLATDPVLDSRALASALGTRTADISPKMIRSLAATAFHLHLSPSEPGWIDLAFGSPLLCSRRARDELLWRPRFGSVETLLELLKGIRDGSGSQTPPLAPRSGSRSVLEAHRAA
jgi:nucleoside-diphosphate-sugar epimerase